MQQAIETVNATVADLRALAEYLPDDEYAVRLTVDTNTLIDNPDLTAHIGTVGQKYMAHLLPVVLREIDELKRAARPRISATRRSALTDGSKVCAPTGTCSSAFV